MRKAGEPMTDLIFRRAGRADLEAIVDMLVDDMIGKGREDGSRPLNARYIAAFDAIARLVRSFGGRVWIVSKCGKKIEARSRMWLERHPTTPTNRNRHRAYNFRRCPKAQTAADPIAPSRSYTKHSPTATPSVAW